MLSRLLSAGAIGGKADGWVLVSVEDNVSPTLKDLYIYPWNPTLGFGAQTVINLTNASSSAPWATLAPDGETLYFKGSSSSTGYLNVYPFSAVTGTLGSIYSPSIPSGGVPNFALVTPDSNNFFVGSGTSPYVRAFPFDPSTGIGTAYDAPSSYSLNTPYSGDVSPDGSVVVFGGYGSTPSTATIQAWEFSSVGGFGSKYDLSNLGSTYPTTIARPLKFSPDGTKLAVGFLDDPFVRVYTWDNSSGWLAYYEPTSYALGGDAPRAPILSLAWSKDNNYLVCGTYNNISGAHCLMAYPISSNGVFGSQITPGIAVTDYNIRSLAFTTDGNALFVARHDGSSSNIIDAYKWIGTSGFGTKYTTAAGVTDKPISVNFTYLKA